MEHARAISRRHPFRTSSHPEILFGFRHLPHGRIPDRRSEGGRRDGRPSRAAVSRSARRKMPLQSAAQRRRRRARRSDRLPHGRRRPHAGGQRRKHRFGHELDRTSSAARWRGVPQPLRFARQTRPSGAAERGSARKTRRGSRNAPRVFPLEIAGDRRHPLHREPDRLHRRTRLRDLFQRRIHRSALGSSALDGTGRACGTRCARHAAP